MQENPPSEHYKPVRSASNTMPSSSFAESTDLRNRFSSLSANSRHTNNPLLQSPSVVRTPERRHASTVSRPSHISTPQAIAREFADSLAGEGEIDVFADPPDMLPPGVSSTHLGGMSGFGDVGGLDDERIRGMMEAMMNAMTNNPSMNRTDSSHRQKTAAPANDAPAVPNLQQQTAQERTNYSSRIWKLIHMISICVLAVWALYRFATSPEDQMEGFLYDVDIDLEDLNTWQRAAMRLGSLAVYGTTSGNLSNVGIQGMVRLGYYCDAR